MHKVDKLIYLLLLLRLVEVEMAQKSTRLGDLLVEQRTISALQLREAIELQESRRLNHLHSLSANSTNVSSITRTTENHELGEILIELGFISRHQLTSSLSWQRSLRKATTVMVFIAPLLTAACGGGAASSSDSNPQSNNVSSQALSNQEPTTTPSSAAQASKEKSSTAKSSTASSTKEVIVTPPASVAAASAPSSKTVSSSKASAPIVSSSKPAVSSLASSSVKSSVVDGPVQLYWEIPKEREDGERLDVTEISGYEVRYKLKSDAGFQSVNISDGYTDAYYFTYLQGDYEFQIATYDRSGLYSSFVSVSPY